MRNIRTDLTILALEFSPDGRFLASGGWNHVGLWDMLTGELTKIEQENCQFVTSIAFSKDASHLLWICGQELRSAALAEGRQTASKSLTSSSAGARRDEWELAVEPEGRVLTVANEQCVTWMIDSLKREPVRLLQFARTAVSIWQSPSGRVPTRCLGAGQPRTAFDYLPEGTLLARTDGENRFAGGSLVVWPVGDHQAIFSQDQPRLNAIAFTPDGCRMIVCEERSVCTWDTSRWQRLEQFDWDIGSPQCVAVSPDGLTAAASGFAGGKPVWIVIGGALCLAVVILWLWRG